MKVFNIVVRAFVVVLGQVIVVALLLFDPMVALTNHQKINFSVKFLESLIASKFFVDARA
jgi:hypothetical protein